MRLIDADDFVKDLHELIDDSIREGNMTMNTMLSLMYVMLMKRPTVIPDKIIHCRECEFWRRPPSCEGLARCETGEAGIRYRSKNDFCSRGAKMEAE